MWLCGVVQKPILKLTYKDYIENSLGELLEQGRTYDQINIDVFNDLQHTITGWPGGKPNADDSTRPVPSNPYPKRIVIFSPHPDDDVISMGGTFIRLVQQGHDVHVAYETSGNVAVHDDVVLQNIDTARELGYGNHYAEVEKKMCIRDRSQTLLQRGIGHADQNGNAARNCRTNQLGKFITQVIGQTLRLAGRSEDEDSVNTACNHMLHQPDRAAAVQRIVVDQRCDHRRNNAFQSGKTCFHTFNYYN